MAKFRVCARCIDYLYVDVEADDESEAFAFANGYIDGGDYHNNGGDWEMGDVCELDPNADVDYTLEDVKEMMEDGI